MHMGSQTNGIGPHSCLPAFLEDLYCKCVCSEILPESKIGISSHTVAIVALARVDRKVFECG